ncbi:GNAT family N-acetyltransferase [Amphiplicatus metriothermophilus]|uniref:Ribosomal-protein-alanine acetyltransferase n=1 Tax=Amphiplicatus metriothermophilus TaxID=1519374 RepID=A0A239PT85_9PROT|nr:GNAT family N-acetyltransferase [Amphiplicatus metriothermophilus]MBB5519301.1 ribosomal-protein-alanine acetyltransferase [Amphiplicatus metriothermophilus]SNT73370.1 ribosomal-protein-alanine acetyltransferase [Amphiplicatus metriothermophilus]
MTASQEKPTPARLRVRAAAPEDLDAIDAIEAASFAADRFARRNLARLLRRPTAAFLLAEEKNGAPVGYALLLFRKGAKAARLYSLAVAPAARGRGAARRLVDAAAALALKRGCGVLRLEVRESNRAARAMYESAGFRARGRKPNYYVDGETAFFMELRLDERMRATR